MTLELSVFEREARIEFLLREDGFFLVSHDVDCRFRLVGQSWIFHRRSQAAMLADRQVLQEWHQALFLLLMQQIRRDDRLLQPHS